MRYVIVCLVKGEAGEFHKELVHSVSKTFTVQVQKLPAHFTIKAPFECDDISEVEKITEEFCKKTKKCSILMEGYNHFGNKVIFMDIKPSEEAVSTVKNYTYLLRKIPWLEWKSNEKGEKRFHCTIVSRRVEDKFESIWKFVNNFRFSFDVEFDNISILIWSKDRWVTHKECLLK